MSLVTIWSPVKKAGKSTVLFGLVKSLQKRVSKDSKVLVLCMNLGYGNVLKHFGIDASQEINLEDIVNYRIHPSNDVDILKSIPQKDNIYFLGTHKTKMQFATRNMKIFENVIMELKSKFELVLFDVISGTDNPLTNMVLDKSDSVITVITQDKEHLDNEDFKKENAILYIVNNYKDIYPNESDLKSIYTLKNIVTIPECHQLIEMKNKNRLDFYNQHETAFNTSIDKVAQIVIGKTGLKEEVVKVTEKRSFLKLLSKGGKA